VGETNRTKMEKLKHCDARKWRKAQVGMYGSFLYFTCEYHGLCLKKLLGKGSHGKTDWNDYSMESSIVISEFVRQYRISKALEIAISEWKSTYDGKTSGPDQQKWLEKRALEIFEGK